MSTKQQIADHVQKIAEAAFIGVDATYRNDSEDAREKFRTVLNELMRFADTLAVADDVRDVDDRL